MLGSLCEIILRRKRMMTRAEAMAERDGRWLMAGGLVV